MIFGNISCKKVHKANIIIIPLVSKLMTIGLLIKISLKLEIGTGTAIAKPKLSNMNTIGLSHIL